MKKSVFCLLLFCVFVLFASAGMVSAAETGSNAVPKTSSFEELVAEFRENGMPEEILFVTRKPSTDVHWYANIGYYADNSCRVPFPRNSGGAIWIFNVKTKACRKIFEDPEGNVRDPQSTTMERNSSFRICRRGKNTTVCLR